MPYTVFKLGVFVFIPYQVEKEDVPVLLVGGGSILVDLSVPLSGASRVVVPEHHWVSEVVS